jgi:4-carboxymuconolactone decarboxylase
MLGVVGMMMCCTGPVVLAQLPPPPPGAYDAAPWLGQIRNEYVYGDVWERPGLSPRDRSMITVAVTQALNAASELRLHMGRALDNGLTQGEIEETLAQVQWYLSLPSEVDGPAIAAEVFAERGLTGRGRVVAGQDEAPHGLEDRARLRDRRALPRLEEADARGGLQTGEAGPADAGEQAGHRLRGHLLKILHASAATLGTCPLPMALSRSTRAATP